MEFEKIFGDDKLATEWPSEIATRASPIAQTPIPTVFGVVAREGIEDSY